MTSRKKLGLILPASRATTTSRRKSLTLFKPSGNIAATLEATRRSLTAARSLGANGLVLGLVTAAGLAPDLGPATGGEDLGE